MDDRDANLVAGLVRGDRLAERVDRCDLLAVDRDDHVPAELVALAGDDDLGRAAFEAGLRGGAAGLDGSDEHALLRGEAEHAGDVRAHVLERDAEERAVDVAVLDELRDDALDGVDRDGEADADVSAAAVRGLDLRVDADHAALRVDQRAARVAVLIGASVWITWSIV